MPKYSGASLNTLLDLVDGFSREIKGEMVKRGGFVGWDNPEIFLPLCEAMTQKFSEGDMLGAATFALFIWNLQDDVADGVPMQMVETLPPAGSERLAVIDAMCTGYRHEFYALPQEMQDVLRKMMAAVLMDGIEGRGFKVVKENEAFPR